MSDDGSFMINELFDACLLTAPSQPPERTPRGLLSPFYVLHCNKKTHVPWAAIVRDREAVAFDEETFPNRYNTTYRDVIVLRAMEPSGRALFGWFIKRLSGQLQLLNRRACVQIAINCTEENPACSLVCVFPAFYFVNASISFLDLAVVRFMRVHHVLLRVSKVPQSEDDQHGKTERQPQQQSQQQSHGSCCADGVVTRSGTKRKMFTCAICLEDRLEQRENRACSCKVQVCTSCDDQLRGLCPICERNVVNGSFFCAACGRVHPLKMSGFLCVSCKMPSVCGECFTNFAECANCDTVSQTM